VNWCQARELGLGITPWSPLAGGVLSGKFRREDAATATSDRGARALSRLTERTFTILDEVTRVAAALGTTPAAVALAWVQSRPGVASTIIGARRLDQFDANLALDLVPRPTTSRRSMPCRRRCELPALPPARRRSCTTG
jgi:aryl-alcohol dehydrogenase-like predicted oxidoreductase